VAAPLAAALCAALGSADGDLPLDAAGLAGLVGLGVLSTFVEELVGRGSTDGDLLEGAGLAGSGVCLATSSACAPERATAAKAMIER